MAKPKDLVEAGGAFTRVLHTAVKLPLIRVNRDAYLRRALKRYCPPAQIEAAVATSPAQAGVSLDVIAKAAKSAISYETSRVTALSAAAGLPGGLAMIGTVAGDVAQYMGHVLRVAQKMAYLYSWPNLFAGDGDLDESTESILTLFVGVMFGVHWAQGGVKKVAEMIAQNVAQKLPQRALSSGAIYPIVKRVAASIGVSMTKRSFASGVAKVVPLAGAVISGGLSWATFMPMAKRLQKHLASYEHAKPIGGQTWEGAPSNEPAGEEASEAAEYAEWPAEAEVVEAELLEHSPAPSPAPARPAPEIQDAQIVED
ncbi:MAG: hypothetical protein Q3999_03885 [Buchananella hordeovulneris]|nr:hypothetical protein [Buchananella hordeovulneris]